MVNELERFVRPNGTPYSYVFDGMSGYLDHALASASLDGQVAGVTEWHNNADEPPAIDYNLGDTSRRSVRQQRLPRFGPRPGGRQPEPGRRRPA
jgi:predicted extracellular nuclease